MNLKILVQQPDVRKHGEFREIYRNTLTYDANVSIPFNRLYDGLRILYPQNFVVISFIVS